MNQRILLLNRLNSIFHHQLRSRTFGRTVRRKDSIYQENVLKTDQVQTENLKKLFDNSLYHDKDYDYVDPRQFQKDNRKQNTSRSLRFIHKEDRNNALFQDDFVDDFKPTFVQKSKPSQKSIAKRNVPNTEIVLEKAPKRHLNEHERKIVKREGRKLYPLPFDINEENRFDILSRHLIPLHSMPYKQQLAHKYKNNEKVLRMFGEKLSKCSSPVQIPSSGLPCPLELVVPSSRIEQYRNKDEFNVWPGVDGNTKTVGFLVGRSSTHEKVVCVEPDHVCITKDSHIQLAKSFQEYLRNISELDYCQNYGFAGNWRRMTVRSNEAGQTMVILNMHPQQLTQEQLKTEFEQVRKHFKDSVDSLYVSLSENIRSTHSKSPEVLHHLSGSKTISENIFDMQFEISPSSFFQINVVGAHSLYATVIEQLGVEKDDVVIDFCCGIGTLSLLLAPYCHQVLGIDSFPSSIEDARRNAELNSLKNVEFICQGIEKIVSKLRHHFEANRKVVAVLNPTRRGLPPYVIQALRDMRIIEKIVYISCKPEAEALDNFSVLCNESPNLKVSRFVPISAVPVDMFPHTDHCELVMTFERF